MRKTINIFVLFISFVTIVSGLTQMVAPAFVLHLVGADITDTSALFFAIIGMFMTLFGALMLHALYSPSYQGPAILWCSMQKLGAFLAVSLGIINGLLTLEAGLVALFDLFSGLLYLYYLYLVKQEEYWP